MGDFLCVGDIISLYCEETEGYIFSWQIRSACLSAVIVVSLTLTLQNDQRVGRHAAAISWPVA